MWVCVCAYVRQFTPFLCAWLHPYIENLLSLTVQEWIRHRSLFLWWRDKIKTYQSFQRFGQHSRWSRRRPLFPSPSLQRPAYFPLHFYSFIGFQNCDIPFRLRGCWCCSAGRLPGAVATGGWSLRGTAWRGPRQEERLDVHPVRCHRLAGWGQWGAVQV